MDTLSRGFLKSSNRHSKSVASLLCETGDDGDLGNVGDNKGVESIGRHYSGAGTAPAMIEAESGYSSIENNHNNLPAENGLITNNNQTNGLTVSSEVTNIILKIIRSKLKMTRHFYSEILEQTVSFHLSSNEAEMMIDSQQQFVAENKEKLIYELRNEILDNVAKLREEKKILERACVKIHDLLQSQKSVFKFVSFWTDLDSFVNLSVKVELKLQNLTGDEGRSFMRLKLENQMENLKEIKVWMNQRQSVLKEDFSKLNLEESLSQMMERRTRNSTQLCLALENIKNLDNVLMIMNYL